MARPRGGDLLLKRLGEFGGGAFTGPGYARELGTLHRLDEARWITWGEDLAHLFPARTLAEHVPEERLVLRTSHMGTQFAAALEGVGVMFSDPQSARRAGLVEVPLSPSLRRALPPLRGGEVWLVVHRALREIPRIAAVFSFLEEAAREIGLSAGGGGD